MPPPDVYYPPKHDSPTPEPPQPQPGRRCCGLSRKLCIVLTIVAAVLLVALALGLGLGLGLKKHPSPLRSNGATCNTSDQCINFCISSVCGPLDSSLAVDGTACTSSLDCINNCVAGICSSKLQDQAACTLNSECASGACGRQSSVCLSSPGAACTESINCATEGNSCLNGVCI